MRDAILALGEATWSEASEEDGPVRGVALVNAVTGHLNLFAFPVGSRVIVRRERPHPGAQLSLFVIEAGWRPTAFVGAPRPGEGRDPGPLAALELRHCAYARVGGRIRQVKAVALRSLPRRDLAENEAWLECVLAAADLVCWSNLIYFADHPVLARCEAAASRCGILSVATRLARSGRGVHLRLDRHWSWSKQLVLGFEPLRMA